MKLDLERNPDSPLYQRLTDELRRQVEDGQLRPGDRMPSFTQLREDYGLHKKTVDRAHSLLEQDGVIVREKRKGVFVAPRPGLRKSAKTGIVGYCGLGRMLSSSSPYWSEILSGIQEVLEAHSMQLLLADWKRQDIQEKVDGAIVDISWARPQEAWHSEKWPCVQLFSGRPAPEVSSVEIDEFEGQSMATRHLLSLGHRRIAYLHGVASETLRSRRAGYQAALDGAGITFEPRWARPLNDDPAVDFQKTGRESMAAWLRDDWRALDCTAIMCQNDETAIGAIEALVEAGMRVPHDISVMGFDGTRLCEYSRPQLTSVEVPLRAIGKRAAELVLQQIELGVHEFEHITLPTRVIARESTAPPGSSPDAADH